MTLEIPHLFRGTLRLPAVLVRVIPEQDLRYLRDEEQQGDKDIRTRYTMLAYPVEVKLNTALCNYEMAEYALYRDGTGSQPGLVSRRPQLTPPNTKSWILDTKDIPDTSPEKLSAVHEKLIALCESFERYTEAMNAVWRGHYGTYYEEFYAAAHQAFQALHALNPKLQIPAPHLRAQLR